MLKKKYVKITRVVNSSDIFLGTQYRCLKPSSFTQEEMKTINQQDCIAKKKSSLI